MSLPSKGEFFQLLKKSRLLAPAQRVKAKELCRGLSTASAAAEELARKKFLTPWQAAQLLQGRTRFFLGKYKLLKFRGRGAMGIVFKAEHPDLNRTVAVKVLSKSLLNRPRSVARFLREIRSTAVLNHPNLVVAYDADQVGDSYFLVMEYVSGRSLKALCQEHGRLPVLWSCECIRQASLALKHIHERGLVHRDVKPSNLLVTVPNSGERPQIKLLDIGLARFVSETEEDGGLTRDGQIVGTGDYMAPEQVAKAKEADIRADLYGLGATLFQLLTGSPPLAGGTFLQTYMNRLQQAPPLLSTLRSGIPPGLDAVVAKMLKCDPEERYRTPDEVAADLAAVLSGTSLKFADVASVSAPVSPALPISDSGGFPEFASGQGSVNGSFDSSPELLLVGLASTSEGTGSTDCAVEASLNEFLDHLSASSADISSLSRRHGTGPQPVSLLTFTRRATRSIRALARRFNRMRLRAQVRGRQAKREQRQGRRSGRSRIKPQP